MSVPDAPVPSEPTRPAVICAWCKATLHEGAEPPSHGVCDRCLKERLALPPEIVPIHEPEKKRDEPAA